MILTPNQNELAIAIQEAAFNNGPMEINGYNLSRAVAHVKREIDLTFTPNRCDPDDTPIGSGEEIRWQASALYAREVA